MIDRRTQHKTIQTHSESDTEKLGAVAGRRIDRGLCICLVGSLGSGKSVMARGVCRGLGVRETVVSPSFILCEEYDARMPVIHIDLYRLEHEREIEELGVFDRMGGNAEILAEWGDRSERLLKAADVIIHLSIEGDLERTIRFDYDKQLASILDGLES